MKKLPKRIKKLFDKIGFRIDEAGAKKVLGQIDDDRRYVYVVGTRNGKEVFLKIVMDWRLRTHKAFTRQILFSKYLKENNILPVRGVLEYNLNPLRGLRYALFEVLDLKAKIGFIDTFKEMESLTKENARMIVREISTLHNIRISNVPWKLRLLLVKQGDSYRWYRKDILHNLNRMALPLDSSKKEKIESVLSRRFKNEHFKEDVERLMSHWSKVVRSFEGKGKYFVHGDLSPNNLYVHDNGNIEFLDYEWIGVSKNKLLALVIDFGNLRARAWNNKKFRMELDKEMMNVFSEEVSSEFARAVVSLGILRSHLLLTSFFENYPQNKQKDIEQKERRELTELDLPLAWKYSDIGANLSAETSF